jgi:hypothetical protein
MYYDALLSSLPTGLEKAILKVLRYHEGETDGIFKNDLIVELANIGYSSVVDERQLRIAIYNLRKQGVLIGSSSEHGYFMIRNLKEFDDFAANEYQKKINDMTDTLNLLRSKAIERFGNGYQEGFQL